MNKIQTFAIEKEIRRIQAQINKYLWAISMTPIKSRKEQYRQDNKLLRMQIRNLKEGL